MYRSDTGLDFSLECAESPDGLRARLRAGVMSATMSTDIHRTIDAIWRIESAKLIARLARTVRDVGWAEELAQDAFVAALQQWPDSGIPDNPAGWLLATAKHRAIDRIRQQKTFERKQEDVARRFEEDRREKDADARLDDAIGDDLLRLIFTACHPVLSTEARAALALRLLGGLTTDEIARAYLVPEPTIAQRIVRAKKTLSEKQVPFEVPRGAELDDRLSSVLEVIYLIFNEGYTATTGQDWMRPTLCEEALRLGRILAELMPDQSEVHGLVALMEIQASRLHARTTRDGEPILLLDQNRAKWDHVLIQRGLAALDRAKRLNAAVGPYVLQAAIAACHARARTGDQTDWAQVAALYADLAELIPSPVIELSRAVAVSMELGPQAGLEIVDSLRSQPSLTKYHLFPSVRGDLLFKLNRKAEAKTEFEKAAAMTQNAREQSLLLQRAAACE